MKAQYTLNSSQDPVKVKIGEEEDPVENAVVDFEEAIARTGQGWFHLKLQLICGVGLMSTLVEMLCTGYALPAAQCDLDISTEDKGFINAICYVGMLFGSHLWGFLADTRGRRLVLVLTLLLDCACTVLESFVHAAWLLLVFRFFNGFFVCGSAAVLFAYLGEFHSDRTRARAIVWLGIFVAFATILLPGLAWLVIPLDFSVRLPWIEFRSWRLFLVLCTAPALASALLLRAFLPRSPKFALLVGQHQEALRILRDIYAANTGDSPDHYPVKSVRLGPSARRDSCLGPTPSSGAVASKSALGLLKEMLKQTAPLFRPPHLGPNMLACILQFAVLCCANGLLLWLPEIFNRLSQYGAEHPGHGMSVCQVIDAHGAPAANASSSSLVFRPLEAVFSNTSDWTWPVAAPEVSYAWRGLAEAGWLLDGELPWDEQEGALNATATLCSNDVDASTFENTLIIGGATALAYVFAGSVVNVVGKKNLLIGSMVTSGVAGMVLYFMTTPEAVLGVTCVFVGLGTMCVSVVNSIVVELFPTKLRAMAVCLSLMCGRLGTVIGSMLVGLLLEFSCPSVFFVLAGIIFGCGFLGFLIPSQPAPEVEMDPAT